VAKLHAASSVERSPVVPRRSAIFVGLLATLLLFPSQASWADTYEVGPDKAYQAISDVPWESLRGGDVVLIHWRAAPYAEKVSISVDATAAAPLVVRGVPGPGGALPVIDGNAAGRRPALAFWNEARGVVRVGGATVPLVETTRHVLIENLEIKGAHPSNTFVSPNGAMQPYAENAAAIDIEQAEDVTVRNCILRGSAMGLFASEPKGLRVEGSSLLDNGIVSDHYAHNLYVSGGAGVVLETNRLGPMIAGSVGSNVKDSSAGLVVRYNWIEGGNRQLDLVDSDNPDVVADSGYRTTYVYGNVMLDPNGAGSRVIVSYGGDSGTFENYRKGVLHFYNNTIVSLQNGPMTAFNLATPEEAVDARNNIFFSSFGVVAFLGETGVASLSRNWLNEGWVPSLSGGSFVLNGGDSSLVGGDPGFTDLPAQDYELSVGSQCIDAGAPLAPDVQPHYPPEYEYVRHASSRARPVDSALDIGAYERPGGVIVDLAIYTTSLAGGVEGYPYAVTVFATGGIPPYRWSTGDGVLPPGLSLNEANGTISGVPITSGSYSIVMRVADSQQPPCVGTREFNLEITPSLESRLDAAQARITQLESQLANAQQTIGALTSQNAQSQEQVDNLTGRVGALTEQIYGLTAQLAALTSGNAVLQVQLNQAQGQVASLTAQMAALLSERVAVQTQLDLLNGALSSGLMSLQGDFRSVFASPAFTIPGGTNVAQYQNLVRAVLTLNKGRKTGVYEGLGGK
jgi:uncharacterized coiled-coil protein SlyX